MKNMLYEDEPVIRIGIMLAPEILFELTGDFWCGSDLMTAGTYSVRYEKGNILWRDRLFESFVELFPVNLSTTFKLKKVTIGIGFHWEQVEDQEFEGGLVFQIEDQNIRVVNRISIENYLKSVISSEMSAMNDENLLKAHAIISRSWLLAQIRNRNNAIRMSGHRSAEEIVTWYDREDHADFDVCADDHCQRYQGISRVKSDQAWLAVQATRGEVLTWNGGICDARFSKCCGGISEDFKKVWQPAEVPYLVAVSDFEQPFHPDPSQMEFYTSAPAAYCNTSDPEILQQILVDFDQSTTRFFRWKIQYTQQELSGLLFRKSGIDFGTILDLEVLERGQSGRIVRLRIVGTQQTIIVGKELEIRKWLSDSHLYSSAFFIDKQFDGTDTWPSQFILFGAGWGHGVGLCQIGAAVMSQKGYSYQEILSHYYNGTTLERVYR